MRTRKLSSIRAPYVIENLSAAFEVPARNAALRFVAVAGRRVPRRSRSENKAFAGLHNEGRRVLVVYDEASAIPELIWETTEGALTDANTEIVWLACGNPTRNTGRFRECFGRFRHRWITRQVDSRTARLTNKDQIEQWIKDYGEDSDFVRVRVRGVFPRAGSLQFISSEIVEKAASYEWEAQHGLHDPRIMGVDVARFGDDQTVIRIRIGRDARSIPPMKSRGVDTMQVAARIVEEARKHRIDPTFVDGGGVGGGVVDRLRYLRQPVTEVQFGGTPDHSQNPWWVRSMAGLLAVASSGQSLCFTMSPMSPFIWQ